MNDAVLRAVIILASVSYGGALILYLMRKVRFGGAVWIIAELLSIILVANNFVVNGYVPFVSMYQLLTFAASLFGLLYLYVAHLCRADNRWAAPYFIGCSLVVSIGLCFMDIHSVWHFPPALRSIWFVPHIFVYVIAYIMAAAAFAMTVTKFFIKRDGSPSQILQRKKLDGGIYDCVCLLFPCMTMGMLFGAVWANEVWGAFWSWDVKECWSLVTWLTFMTWLHIRRSPTLSKYKDALIIAGFAFVIITFFFVNQMTPAASSLHTYN